MRRVILAAIIVAIAIIIGAYFLLAYNGQSEPVNEDESIEIALDFVKDSSTFRFDGISETLLVKRVDVLESLPLQYIVTITFQSRYAGYGDRMGQNLIEVITPHTARIHVKEGRVVSATLDDRWDMIKQEDIPNEIREFLVEDPDGDSMVIQVNLSRWEAIAVLLEMSETGERKWVGGEIESFDNEFGFRFKPDTITVADITAEGLQASKYRSIQQDFEYWRELGIIYIFGRVLKTIE